MEDVFGRPLNLQSTQGHPNRRPLAPNPLAGTVESPQDEAYSGPRMPNEPSWPGAGRIFTDEMVNSTGGIKVSQSAARGGGQPDPTTAPTMWHGSPGGYAIPPATPRPEGPAITGPSEDALSNLR